MSKKSNDDESQVEIFTLGEPASIEETGFFIGDTGPVTLENENPATPSPSANDQLETWYHQLLEAGSTKEQKTENFYNFFNLANFAVVDESKAVEINRRAEECVSLIENEWGASPNTATKATDLVAAITRARGRLTSPDAKKGFDRELVDKFLKNLETHVDIYLGTNQIGSASLEGKEYQTLVENYEKLNLISRKNSKVPLEKFHARVRELVTQKKGIILTADEEFVRLIKKDNDKDILDSPENREKIFGLYRELKEGEHYIQTLDRSTFVDTDLEKQGMQLLEQASIRFIPRVTLFEKIFFMPFIAQNGLNLENEIDSAQFGQIQAKAQDFGLSEQEFSTFCINKKLRRRKDVGHKFSFGIDSSGNKLEAFDYEGIVKLYQADREKALRNLFDGILASYLDDLGNSQLKSRILQTMQEYANDKEAALDKTIYQLLVTAPFVTSAGVSCPTYLAIAEAFEEMPNRYCDELISNQNHKLYLYLEARENHELAKLTREAAKLAKPPLYVMSRIILALQGEQFKRKGYTFSSLQKIIDLEDKDLKQSLAKELYDKNSKFSVWIDIQHAGRVEAVQYWRELGRVDSDTLSYALEEDAPFHIENKLLFTYDDLDDFVLSKSGDTAFLAKALDATSQLRSSLDFWLVNYMDMDFLRVLERVLTKLAEDTKQSVYFSALADYLSSERAKGTLADNWLRLPDLFDTARRSQTVSKEVYEKFRTRLLEITKRNAGPEADKFVYAFMVHNLEKKDIDTTLFNLLFTYFLRANTEKTFYEKMILPLLSRAEALGIVSPEVKSEQQRFFVSKYEEDILNGTIDQKLELLESIRAINPEHALVKLFDDSKAGAMESINLINRNIRWHNGLQRDLVILGVALTSFIALGFTKLSTLVRWDPLELESIVKPGVLGLWTLLVLGLGLVTGFVLLRRAKKRRGTAWRR